MYPVTLNTQRIPYSGLIQTAANPMVTVARANDTAEHALENDMTLDLYKQMSGQDKQKLRDMFYEKYDDTSHPFIEYKNLCTLTETAKKDLLSIDNNSLVVSLGRSCMNSYKYGELLPKHKIGERNTAKIWSRDK